MAACEEEKLDWRASQDAGWRTPTRRRGVGCEKKGTATALKKPISVAWCEEGHRVQVGADSEEGHRVLVGADSVRVQSQQAFLWSQQSAFLPAKRVKREMHQASTIEGHQHQQDTMTTHDGGMAVREPPCEECAACAAWVCTGAHPGRHAACHAACSNAFNCEECAICGKAFHNRHGNV